MSLSYDETAREIVKFIGGRENVKDYYHCATRLRFYLYDDSLVDLEAIKLIPGVAGAQYGTDQLQIIIGNHVSDIYTSLENLLGKKNSSEQGQKSEKRKFSIQNLFETMAAIFLPIVPVLAGTGMIKGLYIILETYFSMTGDMPIIQLLQITSDTVFYFLPFFVAWSAALRFNTKVPLAIALAGCLLYPIMTEGYASGGAGIHLLGLTIPFVRYTGSSIPILLSVWVLSYVEPWIDRHVPQSVRFVFSPMIVMVVMVPLTLIIIAPAANYISIGLASLISFLFNLSPLIGGLFVGATRALVVMSGMHLSLAPIMLENIASYGYDYILPINTMGTLAMVGVTLGVWKKSRDPNMKSVSFSAFISAVIGITEPAIYGVLIKQRKAMIATMVAGGAAGAFVGHFGGTASAYVNSSLLSLPVFVGPGFTYTCIGMVIAAVLGFVLVQVMGLDEEEKVRNLKSEEGEKEQNTVLSPIKGDVIPLQNVDDEAFAGEMMGKGVAVHPSDSKITAPFDGRVLTTYPTKHAIGLVSHSGIELFIHFGLDTAELEGKYFNIKVEEGQEVIAGDTIAVVDFDGISSEGYSIITPIIVTNTRDYLDVLPEVLEGPVDNKDALIRVIK